jgi:hypothetical protein
MIKLYTHRIHGGTDQESAHRFGLSNRILVGNADCALSKEARSKE